MKMTHQNLVEIYNKGGAVASSDWTTGSGNFVAKRPIPAGCVEVEVKNIDTLHGQSRVFAQKVIAARPRVRKVIVVDDVRLAEKLFLDSDSIPSHHWWNSPKSGGRLTRK